MTEVSHDIPSRVGKTCFCALKAPSREGDRVTGALPNNDPELGKHIPEHVHDLGPLTHDQVPCAGQGRHRLLLTLSSGHQP